MLHHPGDTQWLPAGQIEVRLVCHVPRMPDQEEKPIQAIQMAIGYPFRLRRLR